MAAASRPEAVFCCANAQSAHRGAIRANRDRNFIFISEVPILAQRGSANYLDADLVIFNPLTVKLSPPAIGGYGNTANRCGDRQAEAVSQTEALLSDRKSVVEVGWSQIGRA